MLISLSIETLAKSNIHWNHSQTLDHSLAPESALQDFLDEEGWGPHRWEIVPEYP